MPVIIPQERAAVDDQTAPKVEYGVTPTEVMASMAGVDFVRAIFDGRLPTKFADRTPKVVHAEDGDGWQVDDQVVFMTGLSETEHVVQGLAAGGDSVSMMAVMAVMTPFVSSNQCRSFLSIKRKVAQRNSRASSRRCFQTQSAQRDDCRESHSKNDFHCISPLCFRAYWDWAPIA